MQSARHKDVQSAQRYSRDSSTLLRMAHLNHWDVDGTVCKWNNIYVDNPQLIISLNERGSARFSNLFDTSQAFLEQNCKATKGHVAYSIIFLFERIFAAQQVKDNKELIREWVDQYVKEGAPKDLFMTLIADYTNDRVL